MEEQAGGFCTMIEENLALPFTTRVLGVDVSVVAVDGRCWCPKGRMPERRRTGNGIGLTDLPLPSPLPSGAEWIAAYRRWVGGQRGRRVEGEE